MDEALKLQIYFQILGDSNRLKIIKFIGEKECSVSEIVDNTKLSQPLVSHHLRVLRENQVLETKRKGAFIYYKLKDDRLLSALGIFLEIVSCLNEEKMTTPMFSIPDWWNMCK
jgi:DNA-binding transcriptional ArsR family regulator